MTLLDVLSGIDELKIVVSYELNGQTITHIPAEISDFESCKPNYITLPGWKEDITEVKSFEELPVQAQNYLNRLCENVGVPLAIFSVGPDRSQTIQVKAIF